MTVWAATDFTTGTTTLLVARPPMDMTKHILRESSDLLTLLLSHPLLIRLHILQSVAENHRQITISLSRALSREVSHLKEVCRPDVSPLVHNSRIAPPHSTSQEHSGSRNAGDYTRLSERYLLSCR